MEDRSKEATRIEEFKNILDLNKLNPIAMGIRNPAIFKRYFEELEELSEKDLARYGYAAGIISFDDMKFLLEESNKIYIYNWMEVGEGFTMEWPPTPENIGGTFNDIKQYFNDGITIKFFMSALDSSQEGYYVCVDEINNSLRFEKEDNDGYYFNYNDNDPYIYKINVPGK